MADELDRLTKALQTPPPASKSRAETLARAMENFDRHQETRQETAQEARPTSENRPMVGRLTEGLKNMLSTLTSTRGFLTASTAIAAVGLIVILPQSRDLLTPPGQQVPAVLTEEKSAERPLDSLAAEADQAEAAAVGSRRQEQTEGYAQDAAPEPAPAVIAEVEPSISRPAPAPMPKQALKRDSRGVAASQPVGGIVADDGASLRVRTDTEAFANEAPNPVKVTTEEPVSTFSIDVDTASYAVVRSSLMAGMMPPPDAVRVEEMVNYFPYDYPVPDAGQAFRPSVSVMQTPWNPDTQLVTIAVQGASPAVENRPPLNLVFLIDTSGSMQDADKLPLLKQSFRLMLNQLGDNDRIAIVTYAGSAGQVLAPTPASDRATILAALDRLEAGGSTAGQAGLQQAYQTAAGMARDGAVSRVLLATDGDFNVGLSNPEALKSFIADQRGQGTYLSVLGFGRGNLDDATMQALAQNGNGQAAYIDTLNEARKVLVDQLTGALFPIADDVKIQVEWNPATVAEYRLIGYETRALRREDFNNDKVDAGEIGAGTSVTAIYEVTPVGSPAMLNDELRYQPSTAVTGPATELGFLRLRHKAPGTTESQLQELPIPVGVTEAGTEARFAAAIAGFGQLLRGSDYLGDWTYEDAITLANGAKGADGFGYRAEAVQLMRLAQALKQE